ncbi:hypothetical protein GA0115258_12841, partial [Streptomyces sp. LamerLS-31b]
MLNKIAKRTAVLTASAALAAGGALVPSSAFAAPTPTVAHVTTPND